MSPHVHVIGAGFSGLTVSLYLAQRGCTVELYESSDRLGGLLGTETTEYGLAESAANALINTYKAEELFNDLGLSPVVPLKESKKRFIFREVPRRWPLTVFETLSFITRLLPKFIFNRKALAPRPRETLQVWGERNLGHPATQFLIGPAMQGIYASDGQALSSELILGPLFHPKRKTGAFRGMLTGENGMQDVIVALEKRLRELGVRIHLNTQADITSMQGPVIIATSAMAAAKITENVAPQVSDILKKITPTSLLSVKMFYKSAQERYKGFGCLIPRRYGMKTLGVLLNSYIFPGRAKTYNETWIMGGPEGHKLLDLPDSEILKCIAEERFQVLRNKESIVDYRINRWKNALPLYDLELEKALKELKKHSSKKLYLHGNYLGGIGLSKILERSYDLAKEISENV